MLIDGVSEGGDGFVDVESGLACFSDFVDVAQGGESSFVFIGSGGFIVEEIVVVGERHFEAVAVDEEAVAGLEVE